MINSSITNYQTSFRIARDHHSGQFDNIVKCVYDWLCTKERDYSLRNNWVRFKFRGEWQSLYGSGSRIETDTFLEDDLHSWVAEYTHSDRELGSQRFWHTQIGIREGISDHVVAIRVSYSWNQDSLEVNQPAPDPSVPYFVRTLIRKFKPYSGRKEFRLIQEPVTLFKVGQGQVLREFILSIDRKYPLIVFNGDSPAQLSEAKALAIKLAGKAQVLIIKENPELAEELRYVLERDYQIRFGQMRVFFPVNVRRPMPTKHRWFDVSSPFYQEQRQGIINGLLRNHNLVEQGAISSLQDIRRLISRSKLEKLKQTEIGDSANLDEIFQFVKIAENERDEAKAEAAAYAQQVDELEATVSQLEWKEKALETINGGNSSTVESSLFSLPKNILEVVEAAAKIHVGRLEFCKEAFSSAERDKSCEMVAEAWEIISHLASTLHELKFKSSDPGDIAQRFTDESGYEYAKTEGKATKADARLRGLRRINHKGRDFEIWPHIKKGYPLIDSGERHRFLKLRIA